MSTFTAIRGVAATPAGPVARRLAASMLMATSRYLARCADRVLSTDRSSDRYLPRLEFHVDAAGSGGFVYLDGKLIAHLPGVTRL